VILELKPEHQQVLERAAQSGMSPEDVLDQAFAVIHEQYRNDDWLLADKKAIAAQIEEGFAQSEGESLWMPSKRYRCSKTVGQRGELPEKCPPSSSLRRGRSTTLTKSVAISRRTVWMRQIV